MDFRVFQKVAGVLERSGASSPDLSLAKKIREILYLEYLYCGKVSKIKRNKRQKAEIINRNAGKRIATA